MDCKTNKAVWHSSAGHGGDDRSTFRSEFSDLLSEQSQTTLYEEHSQTTVGEEPSQATVGEEGYGDVGDAETEVVSSRSSGSSGLKYEVSEGSKFFSSFAPGQGSARGDGREDDVIPLTGLGLISGTAMATGQEETILIPTSDSQRWRMGPPGKSLLAMVRVLGSLVAEAGKATHAVTRALPQTVPVVEGLMDSLYSDLLVAYMGEAPLVTNSSGAPVGEREADLFVLLTDLDEMCVGAGKRGEWLVCRANHEVSKLLSSKETSGCGLSESGEVTHRVDDVNLLLTHVAMVADYFAFLHADDRGAAGNPKAQFSIPLVTQTMELLLRMQAKLFFASGKGPASLRREWSVDMLSVAFYSLRLLSVVSTNYWQDLPVASMVLTFFFNAENSLSLITLEYIKNLLLGSCTGLMHPAKAGGARDAAMDFLLHVAKIMHSEHFENLPKGPECLSARAALRNVTSAQTIHKYFDPREAVSLMYRIVLQPRTGIATALFREPRDSKAEASQPADPSKVVALVESLLALPAHRLDVSKLAEPVGEVKGAKDLDARGIPLADTIDFHFREMQNQHALVEQLGEGEEGGIPRAQALERIRLHLRVLVAVAGYACRQGAGNVRRCFYNLRTMNFLAEQISFEHIIAVRAVNETRHNGRKGSQVPSPVSVMDFTAGPISEGYASDASTPQSQAGSHMFDLSRAPSLRYDSDFAPSGARYTTEGGEGGGGGDDSEYSEQNMALYSDSSEDEDEEVYAEANMETPVTVPKLDMGLRGASSTGSFSGLAISLSMGSSKAVTDASNPSGSSVPRRPDSSESTVRPRVKTLSRTASLHSAGSGDLLDARGCAPLSLQCLAEDGSPFDAGFDDGASPSPSSGHGLRSIAGVASLETLTDLYTSARQQRALYASPETHVLYLELLLQLMVMGEDGDELDPLYCDPFPVQALTFGVNLSFLLYHHMNKAENEATVNALVKRLKRRQGDRRGSAGMMRLLKLHCVTLLPTVLRSAGSGGFAQNIAWQRINRGAVANICSACVPVDYLSGYYPGLRDEGSRSGACVDLVMKCIEYPKSVHDMCPLGELFNEVMILEKLNGSVAAGGSGGRVVKMWDYGIDGESFCIVLSQAACSLREWRKVYGENASRRGKGFSACKSLYFRVYKMVLDAVIAMSDAGVVHYDIKCDNVLIVPDPEHVSRGVDIFDFEYHGVDCQSMPFSVCIADFGESKVLQKDADSRTASEAARLSTVGLPTEPVAPHSKSESHQGRNTVRNRGTEFIKAPEMLLIANAERRNHQQYDRRKEQGAGRSADVWGVSCLLYELLADEYLFRDDDWIRFFMRVTRETDELMSPERLALVENAPEVIHFLKGALIRDPNLRPSLRNLKVRAQKLA